MAKSKPRTPFVFYKGWAEVEGRKQTRGKPNPKTIYTPRVDGVMPFTLPEEQAALDDETEDQREPVDVHFRKRGIL